MSTHSPLHPSSGHPIPEGNGAIPPAASRWEDLAGSATESRNLATLHIDELSALEIATLMNQEDQKVPQAVAAVLPEIARGIDRMATVLSQGGRVLYVGAGTSGRLGLLDAAEWRPTFGVENGVAKALLAGGPQAVYESVEEAEDDFDSGKAVILREATAKDLVVGITASGNTPFVLGALTAARQLGAASLAIACNRPSRVEQVTDLAILPVVGPEVIAGSTRLKAGTAQKMVLNMLSTGAMIRLGKVYQNLMVDLRPTNEKLVGRAIHTIQTVTGVSHEEATQAFLAADRHVKTAIVMILAGVSAAQARQGLQEAQGFVRKAVSLLQSHSKRVSSSGTERP
ncbi:MAG: N-acetylmuramic acid 6-phosphate etherase [Firmicutes bacterium]|nr:N-acetylmuramic acid 6-phosphate etherase [Bacillota bacterium]